jgi:hypothetical protein
MSKRRPSAAQQRFHDRLRAMGCIVSGRTDRVTIHHVHSGSIAERGFNRGGAQKLSDWLVIPLDLFLHSMGPEAIDGACGVQTWESKYGKQADYIDRLCADMGMDLWALARQGRK